MRRFLRRRGIRRLCSEGTRHRASETNKKYGSQKSHCFAFCRESKGTQKELKKDRRIFSDLRKSQNAGKLVVVKSYGP
jgi:hypothetical protein